MRLQSLLLCKLYETFNQCGYNDMSTQVDSQKPIWDYEVFWNETLNHISEKLTKQEYEMWFSRMEYLRSSKSELYIGVPSMFFQNQVKTRYQKELDDQLRELSGTRLKVHFEVAKPQKRQKIRYKACSEGYST